MQNLIRFYNQNRKSIWRTILIIIAILLFIRLLNYLTVKNDEKKQNSQEVANTTSTNSTSKDLTYTSNKSAVKGTTIQKSKLEHAQDLLDEFFNNCNNQNLEEAYNLLTDECKEFVYPTFESFQKNYYDNVFEGTTKLYSFENWHDNTYYITIKDDILFTGKTNTSDNVKNDYITVIDDKLNIKSYVGRTKIDKENNSKNITIKIDSKDIFMDYEIYNLTIKNDSDNTICLTSAESSKDVYIQDKNDVKYGIMNNEIADSQMYIKPGSTRSLSFKFYSSYVSDRKIKKLVFKNLNLDSDNKDAKSLYEYTIDL